MPQVSVLLLTYNSSPAQIRRALTAIVEQKEVDIEIVISDDGSARKDFSFLPDFMQRLGFDRWQLLEHPVNRGTVYSCLSAADAASGEYAFTTSPGDFLFDEFVLRDFYQFAQKHNSTILFGNAVYYNCDSGKAELSSPYSQPLRPQHYNIDAPLSHGKTAFFSGDWVVGACYFRKLSAWRESLKAIAGKVVYTEDTPTTMYLMAQGHRLCYYDRNMIWYEHGTGISTGGDDRWGRLVRQDLHAGYRLLKERFPADRYIDYAWRHALAPSGLQRSFGNLLRHPWIMVQLRLLQRSPKKHIVCAESHWQQLENILKIQ